MKKLMQTMKLLLLTGLCLALAGCEEPQVYGSIGVSSGYSSYGGYGRYGGGPRMHGSITIGGRIR